MDIKMVIDLAIESGLVYEHEGKLKADDISPDALILFAQSVLNKETELLASLQTELQATKNKLRSLLNGDY